MRTSACSRAASRTTSTTSCRAVLAQRGARGEETCRRARPRRRGSPEIVHSATRADLTNSCSTSPGALRSSRRRPTCPRCCAVGAVGALRRSLVRAVRMHVPECRSPRDRRRGAPATDVRPLREQRDEAFDGAPGTTLRAGLARPIPGDTPPASLRRAPCPPVTRCSSRRTTTVRGIGQSDGGARVSNRSSRPSRAAARPERRARHPRARTAALRSASRPPPGRGASFRVLLPVAQPSRSLENTRQRCSLADPAGHLENISASLVETDIIIAQLPRR